MTKTPEFIFRNKFKKLLTEENQSSIMKAFRDFCNLDSGKAREMLWRMTYSSDIAYGELYKLGLNSQIVPMEDISMFRNEFRTQYEQKHPNFLEISDINPECRKNFFELLNHTDIITANVVYHQCCKAVYCFEEVERILILLKDERENCYCGGIRELGFNFEETQYLKPHHAYIHDLLQSLCDFLTTEEDEEDIFYEEPIQQDEENEEGKVEELSNIENEIEEKRAVYQIPKEYVKLTPEKILAHRDVFTIFAVIGDLNILLEIGKLNFDLNQVMNKKNEIFNLIMAIEAFE